MHIYIYIHTNDRTIYGQGLRVCDILFSSPLELPRRIVEGLCHDWRQNTRFTDSAPSLICLGHKFIFFS